MKYAFRLNGISYVMQPCNLLITAEDEQAEPLALQIAEMITAGNTGLNIEFYMDRIAISVIRDFYEIYANHMIGVQVGESPADTLCETVLEDIKNRLSLFQRSNVNTLDEYRKAVSETDMREIFMFIQTDAVETEDGRKAFAAWNQLAAAAGIYCIVISKDEKMQDVFLNQIEITNKNTTVHADTYVTVSASVQ